MWWGRQGVERRRRRGKEEEMDIVTSLACLESWEYSEIPKVANFRPGTDKKKVSPI